MLLARGKNKWIDLRSSFVNINKLLLFLKQEDFTGCVHLLFPENQGLILFQDGDVVNGMFEEKEQRKSGQSTVQRILGFAEKYEKCRIFVAEFPDETISILSEVFSMHVRMVHERLSSEFTDLGKYIVKLSSAKFTGYLEIRFPQDRRKGMEIILFKTGNIIAIVASQLQFRINNPNKEKVQQIKEYLKEVQSKGIRYSTFAVE